MLMVRKEHSQMLSFVVTNLLNLYHIIFTIFLSANADVLS